MTTRVFWWSDVWGWDAGSTEPANDLIREIEVGRVPMVCERLENRADPTSWFMMLASELERAS